MRLRQNGGGFPGNNVWPENRCNNCNKLLFRGTVEQVEIKCPKCGYLQVFRRGLPLYSQLALNQASEGVKQ